MTKATIIVGHDWRINDLDENFVKIFEINKMDDFTLRECVHETITDYYGFDSADESLQWTAIQMMDDGDLSEYLGKNDMIMMVKIYG